MKAWFVVCLVLLAMTLVSVDAKKLRHGENDWSNVLPNYVNKAESVYSYALLNTIATPYGTVYVLNQTSLSWLDSAEVGQRSKWFNYLVITVPSTLNRNLKQASMYITAGSNTDAAPSTPDAIMTPWAYVTQAVSVSLYQIPNQAVTYASDPTGASRSEDAIIAYGWKKFFGDATKTEYITQLPMVKASKLAMDTAISFVQAKANYTIESFNVIGGSKRGWVAWLLAGIDSRVKSVIPAVIPVLETKKVFKRTYDDICYWPPAMADYIAAGVTNDINTQGFSNLVKVIDPLVYNERLSQIPKFQVMALGDEFFSPELNTLGFSELEGEKYVRYIPNTGHSLAGSDVFQVLLTYQIARLNNIALPQYSFSHKYTDGGAIVKLKVNNGILPSKVTLWQATNPNGREFRTYIIGTNVWKNTTLVETKPFEWQVYVRNPAAGYTAFTIEMQFDNFVPVTGMAALKFTTNAYVVPNTIPCDI